MEIYNRDLKPTVIVVACLFLASLTGVCKCSPLYSPYPMSVGSPLTITCNVYNIQATPWPNYTHVSELRLNKMADDTHASSWLDIRLNPRNPVGERVNANYGNRTDVSISYRGLNLFGPVDDESGKQNVMEIKIQFHSATCLELGSYQCSAVVFRIEAHSEGKSRYLYRDFYIDTKYFTPEIMTFGAPLYELGSTANLTCAASSSIRKAEVFFLIRIPEGRDYLTLPVSVSLFNDKHGSLGDNGKWPQSVPEEKSETAGGPCSRNQYFTHRVNMTFQIHWEKLRASEILCTVRYFGSALDMQTSKLRNFTRVWGSFVNLTECAINRNPKCTNTMIDRYRIERIVSGKHDKINVSPAVSLLIIMSVVFLLMTYSLYWILQPERKDLATQDRGGPKSDKRG